MSLAGVGRSLVQLLGAGALLGGWGGAIAGSMALSLGSGRADKDALSHGIAHVSQRYVTANLSSHPALVGHLDTLADMCLLDATPESIEQIRLLVRRVAQMLHAHGKLAGCRSRTDVFKIQHALETLKGKLDRCLYTLEMHLKPFVDADDMRTAIALIRVDITNFLALADMTADDMRHVLPAVAPAAAAAGTKAAGEEESKSTAAAAAAQQQQRARQSPAALRKLLTPISSDAAEALATFALWAQQAASSSVAHRHIAKLVWYVRQLARWQGAAHTPADKCAAVSAKAEHALGILRFELGSAAEPRDMELPFAAMQNVLSRFGTTSS